MLLKRDGSSNMCISGGNLKPLRLFECMVFLAITMLIANCGGGNSGGDTNSVLTQQMGGARLGKPLTLTGKLLTIAGQPSDGTGSAAQFNTPYGMTTDGINLYVADSHNATIRKVVIATGAVTTLAGSAGTSGFRDGTGSTARFVSPLGIATDGTNLYVLDAYTIRTVVIATGAVTTLAGSSNVSGSTDGTGAAARFNKPIGITIDGLNLYVADTGNNTIRKVVINTGVVTTLAGSSALSGSTDGTGSTARFSMPFGVTTDGTNLYVADAGNFTIRKVVIASGAVTTLVGSPGEGGPTDGTGSEAQFGLPFGITNDGTNLFVTDNFFNTIRKVVIATGVVTTLAGNTVWNGSTDGTGSAARFSEPGGITTYGANLYVADTGNSTIRNVVIANGVVTTLAGNAATGRAADGIGVAARFYNPTGITTDGTNLYVADRDNNVIREVVIATGAVTTLAGSFLLSGSSDGKGTAALFDYPSGIATDGTNLFVVDMYNQTIRKVVIATGAVTTFAGSVGVIGSTDGTGVAARFNYPYGITTDGVNLYVADAGNYTVRKVAIATGAVTTLAGSAGTSGVTDGTGTAALFDAPGGITTDGVNLYVLDTYNHTIRSVVIATGVVTTLAGNGAAGSTDGSGDIAEFNLPSGITTDGTNLYVADTDNNSIRKVVIATGAVTTIARNVGPSSGGLLYSPRGITTDGTKLYVANSANNTIISIQ